MHTPLFNEQITVYPKYLYSYNSLQGDDKVFKLEPVKKSLINSCCIAFTGLFCLFTVTPQVVFSSEYDVRCTDIQSQVSQTAITNVVTHHYTQIENICANGKPF